ncbi:hypothetical protein [Bacillus sinesaloumensis]|uniref:hypothetical protein n=1 Tax=Litchfieldia sinesaloumensis TaxID=1926280 RepID=UPI0009883430|nr:hypothetical protein [Bacillus sinesaloumensis]
MSNNSKRKALIIWGLITMLVIAPLLSWFIGVIYGVSVSSGFAGGGLMVILFPVIFIVGVVILIKGLRVPKREISSTK